MLTFLNTSRAWLPHFYKETSRQLKQLDKTSRIDAQVFLKQFITLYIDSIPVMFRNNAVYEKAARKYLLLSASDTKKEDELYIAYTKIWLEINVLFAAGTIKNKGNAIGRKLERLKPDFRNISDELIYQWYWTLIYLKQSVEDNPAVAQLAETALKTKYKNPSTTLRLQMKYAEALYFTSRFEESFFAFSAIMNKYERAEIPNIGYFTTRYLQVCLITGNFAIVKSELEQMKQDAESRFIAQVTPRDIMTFIKYYILAGEYEVAYEFIRLGFIKNPKAKYLQYEIELRNLETAYFYLSGNIPQALEMCERHLRYLRTKGFGIKKSPYSFYFALVKAYAKKRHTKETLSENEDAMMKVFLRGTNAVYGRMLQKIAAY